jgi:hypothetical protein
VTLPTLPIHPTTAQQVASDQQPAAGAAAAAVQPTEWFQKTITLPQHKRGCHVITRKILSELPEVTEFEVGLANLFSECQKQRPPCVAHAAAAAAAVS